MYALGSASCRYGGYTPFRRGITITSMLSKFKVAIGPAGHYHIFLFDESSLHPNPIGHLLTRHRQEFGLDRDCINSIDLLLTQIVGCNIQFVYLYISLESSSCHFDIVCIEGLPQMYALPANLNLILVFDFL